MKKLEQNSQSACLHCSECYQMFPAEVSKNNGSTGIKWAKNCSEYYQIINQLNNKMTMKKIQTTYFDSNSNLCLTINNDVEDSISIHEFGEPCSGILKYWGKRKNLIDNLEKAIKFIKSCPKE